MKWFTSPRYFKPLARSGMSLIEIAVLLVFISLAMVPVIRTIGGSAHSGAGDNRSFNSVSRQNSHTLVAANSILERAMAGDSTVSFDSNTLTPGQIVTTTRQQFTQDYNRPVWYEWSIRDTSYKMDASGNLLDAAGNITTNPALAQLAVTTGNRLVHATLKVYSQANGGTPVIIMPTILFRNDTAVTIPATSVGIMSSLDVSWSMRWPLTDWALDADGIGLSSPYLMYRYSNEPSVDSSVALNLWDNTQLDLVGAAYSANSTIDPDPSTPFRDNYIQQNIPGLFPNVSCGNSSDFLDYATSPLKLYFDSYAYSNATAQAAVANVCSDKADNADSIAKINSSLSRLEAARTAMFNFLINTEGNAFLVDQTKMGFQKFSSTGSGGGGSAAVQTLVDLEPSQVLSGAKRYKLMRESMAWINRGDPSALGKTIGTENNTRTYDAINEAALKLFADTAISQRIIVLLTDGEPFPVDGTNTPANIRTLCQQLGDGTYPGQAGKKVTIFVIGLLITPGSAAETLMQDMATATPGGVAVFAQTAADLTDLFEEIAYQIQKTVYLNASTRYNL
jgi:hypothetical protein